MLITLSSIFSSYCHSFWVFVAIFIWLSILTCISKWFPQIKEDFNKSKQEWSNWAFNIKLSCYWFEQDPTRIFINSMFIWRQPSFSLRVFDLSLWNMNFQGKKKSGDYCVKKKCVFQWGTFFIINIKITPAFQIIFRISHLVNII